MNVLCKGSIVHTFLGKMINFSYLLNIILIQDRNCNTAFSILLCMYLHRAPLRLCETLCILVCLLHIINVPKVCMDRSRTIDSSGSVNYFSLSQVIRYEFERRIQQILRSHQAFFQAPHQQFRKCMLLTLMQETCQLLYFWVIFL